MRVFSSFLVTLAALLPTPVLAADFGYAAYVAALRSAQVRSVEEAIAVLPSAWRENYVLVFDSRSLQSATPEAPRALLFGGDARFVLSFNGDPTGRGYDAVETMEFDAATSSFHFREISFPAGGGNPEFSADNPARCAACHGRPAHPIWDTPPSWPGVYGERYHAGLSRQEAQGMRAFLAHRPRDSRYSQLIDAQRFGDRSTYVGTAAGRYGGSDYEPPNARLSTLLSGLNARSLAAQLAGLPGYPAYRYALAGAATPSCGPLAGYFPAVLRDEVSVALAQYRQASAVSEPAHAQAKQLRRIGAATGYQADTSRADLAPLRWLAERAVGLPVQRWSLALEEGSDDVAQVDGREDLARLLADLVTLGDPALRESQAFRSYGSDDAYCVRLRERSVAELAGLAAAGGRVVARGAPGPSASGQRPALVARCAGCHTGAVGPALPFDDEALLAARLQATGYPHGRLLDEILYRLTPVAGSQQMPRGVLTSAAEQQALEDYFLQVARAGPARND